MKLRLGVRTRILSALTLLLLPLASSQLLAASKFCGREGVWLQVLGSGGADLDSGRGASSYLIWLDGAARILVDAGPGSALRYSESGADFRDLEAVLFSSLHPDASWDFPALLRRSYFGARKEALAVLAPEGNDWVSGPRQSFAPWLTIDPRQAYPSELLAGMPEPVPKSLPFRIRVTTVPSLGSRTWTGWRQEQIRLAAVPVERGLIPSLAWRVEIADVTITFGGAASGFKGTIPGLAKGSDMLVMHLGASQEVRGALRQAYQPPAAIGRATRLAEARMLLLGHRTLRTLGLETRIQKTIAENFKGNLIFANDNDCFGLSK